MNRFKILMIEGFLTIRDAWYGRNMKILNDAELKDTPYEVAVHVTHCCGFHGCKYRHNDCLVAKGEYAQKYGCEECRSEKNLKAKIASLQKELEWVEKMKSVGVEIPDDADGWW